MEFFPLAWLFFVPFIIVTSFAVLNLFIGIIVDAMQVMHEMPSGTASDSISKDDLEKIMLKLENLEEDISELSKQLNKN